ANAVPVTVTDGGVTLSVSTEVNVVADLTGAFAPTGNGLTPAGPTRVLDTRSTGKPLRADEIREVDVHAPAGATGVVATIAVIGGELPGFLTAFACGTTLPSTSNINFAAQTVVANTVVSQLGSTGKLCVRSVADAHVIVDVTGYLSATGPLSYQALAPTRLLDTRSPTSIYTNRLAAQQVIELPIQPLAGMPSKVWSVVANITAVGASNLGFMTAYPCGGSVPATSSLNFVPAKSVGALTVSSIGSQGSLCIYSSARAHLIVDLVGVWVHDEQAAPHAPQRISPADQGDPRSPNDPDNDNAGGEDSEDAFSGGDVHEHDVHGEEGHIDQISGGATADKQASRVVVESGGCTVAPGQTGSQLPVVLAALIGLAWLGRRRKR
ncbi:MAG: hypothetical protein H0U74_20660, partial [Bradymonadaceae bacterium]|nr:hypothetical protein [Lujinxingiaceae bacterium]